VSAVGVVGTKPDPNPVSGKDRPPKTLYDQVRAWRFLPFETYPSLVAFAQTPRGKLVLVILFAPLLRPLSGLWLAVTVAVGACAYAGQYRSTVVTLATLYVLVLYTGWIDWTPPSLVAVGEGVAPKLVHQLNVAMLPLFFALSAAALYGVRRWSGLPVVRRPIVCLHAAFFILVLLGVSGLLYGKPLVALWSFITTFGAYFWFLCYALKDRRAKDASSICTQLGVFHPFWGSSTTPIGKGAAYLRRVEAKNPRDLAISQLKGLKLLLWVWILKSISLCMDRIAVDHLDIPELHQALAEHVAGHPYAWYTCWASIVYTFLYGMNNVAIFGDTYVACARMAGYPILRNSYRPLSAKSLVDFWNRYYYYFKELLVEIFFFPTFLRYFKSNMRVRLFFATFMAAGAGNLIFHFIKEINSVSRMGLTKTVIGFQCYAFYCAMLAIGIGISQMRRQKAVHSYGWLRGQALPSFGVILFYCLLEVFMYSPSPHPLWLHFTFMFHCFGVDRWT
jgi:hypothetical protein